MAAVLLGAAAPVSGPPDTVPVPPPPEVIVEALLTPDELGVPADWVIRDVDAGSSVADSVPDEALDPFFGGLDCPGDPLSAATTDSWVSRRYAAPEVPLENGLLAIDVTIVVEPPARAEARLAGLDDCEGPDLGVVASERRELVVRDVPVPSGTLELLAPPSQAVPYAAAFNVTVAHRRDSTVIVVFGGVDMGESWQDLSDATAVAALERLTASAPATSSPAASGSSPVTSPPS